MEAASQLGSDVVLLSCRAGLRPCDWLRGPGAGGAGWGALRASAAPRRVSQHSERGGGGGGGG